MVELEVWSAESMLSQEVHRIGQRWQWSPVAKKLGDNRLKPGESRDYTLSFSMPDGPVVIKTRVRHVRLTQSNWKYHMDLFEKDNKMELAQSLRDLPLSEVRAYKEQTIISQ